MTPTDTTDPIPPQPRRNRLSRRKKLIFAAIAVFVSTVFALAIGEFAARWHMEGSFLEALDSITGMRSAAEPGSRQELVEDPVLGFKLNPALEGHNSMGLRYRELSTGKPPGVFRVMLLGDSVGFPMDGFFQDLSEHLHTRLSDRVEVINASVHGYTTYQERMYLERDLLALRPDLVILQYCINDNYRFLHRLTSNGRRLMTLEAKNYLLPEGDGFMPWLTRSSYLVYSVRKLLLKLRTAAETSFPWDDEIARAAWTDASWVDQEEHVGAMANSLVSVGGRLAVLAVPCEQQLDPKLLELDRDYTVKPQRLLGEICSRRQIPYLDLHNEFLSHREDSLFADGLHLTPAGHRLTGRVLTRFLDQQGLIPSR